MYNFTHHEETSTCTKILYPSYNRQSVNCIINYRKPTNNACFVLPGNISYLQVGLEQMCLVLIDKFLEKNYRTHFHKFNKEVSILVLRNRQRPKNCVSQD